MTKENTSTPEVTIETFTKLDGRKQEIRVVTIEGKPWFVAHDVCRALGLTNATTALQHIPPNDKAQSVLGGRERDAMLGLTQVYSLNFPCTGSNWRSSGSL